MGGGVGQTQGKRPPSIRLKTPALARKRKKKKRVKLKNTDGAEKKPCDLRERGKSDRANVDSLGRTRAKEG